MATEDRPRFDLTTAQAYQQYRPLLLSALSGLARRGYAAPPPDGLELVHDFFLEVWPQLTERYDASRGAFSTYLFGAFTRWARPRIVRMLRWQDSLMPPGDAELDGDAPEEAAADRSALTMDRVLVQKALRKLPARERKLLETRIASGRSEREAARDLGLSRYRLREACAEALARLATAIDEPGVIDRADWPVARALWADLLTVAEAASLLGMTENQVKLARQRVLRALQASISQHETEPTISRRPAPRRKTMPSASPASIDLCGLWQQLVAHPENPDVVARARRHLEELSDHVDECDKCVRTGERAADPAAVYLALAGGEETIAAEDRNVLDRMLEANANDERQVADAVEGALLPSLSARVVGQYKQLRELFSEVSPRVVYLAIEAVGMLVRRVAHHRQLVRDEMELAPTGAIFIKGTEIVPSRTVVREISRFAHVAEPTAERLAAWIPSAAFSQPNLFRGLAVSRISLLQKDRVNLTLAAGGEETEDLFARWSPLVHRSYTPPAGIEEALPSTGRTATGATARRGVSFAQTRSRPASTRGESDGRGHSSEAAASAETPSEDKPRGGGKHNREK